MQLLILVAKKIAYIWHSCILLRALSCKISLLKTKVISVYVKKMYKKVHNYQNIPNKITYFVNCL